MTVVHARGLHETRWPCNFTGMSRQQRTSNPPPRPELPKLHPARTAGKFTQHATCDGRFTVTRNPSEPGVPFEDSGYDVVDTRRANILGHGHTNRVRVYELLDARYVIHRVLVLEWLAELQRYQDAQRRALGMPTVVEEAQARMRAERTGLGQVPR